MNIRYDQDADALYIRIAEGVVSRTEQLDEGTLVDIDMHGNVLGIEVLQPARDWRSIVEANYALPPEVHAFLSSETYAFTRRELAEAM